MFTPLSCYTALKFMESDEGWKATALKTYLLERLRHLSLRQGEHKTQKTMLCTWLTELYLRGFTYISIDTRTGKALPGIGYSKTGQNSCWIR